MRAGFTPNTAARATTLVSELAAAIRAAVPDVPSEPVLVQTNNPKYGDYQLNNAMRIFASLRGKVPPARARRTSSDPASAVPALEHSGGLLCRANMRDMDHTNRMSKLSHKHSPRAQVTI